MEPVSLAVVAIVAGISAVGALLALGRRWNRRELAGVLEPELGRAWRGAAEELKLNEIVEGRETEAPPWLAARSADLEVRLDRQLTSEGVATVIAISGLDAGDAGLRISAEQNNKPLAKRLAEREFLLGSPHFDATVRVDGPAELGVSVLDWETRSVLLELLRGRMPVATDQRVDVAARIDGGRLEVTLVHARKASEEQLRAQLSAVLGAVLALARRLERPRDLAVRLAANFESEPEEGVRQKQLRLLIEQDAADPNRRAALFSALADSAEEIRLEAAIALGPEGREFLLELLENPLTSESGAARAVQGLGVALELEAAAGHLKRALGQHHDLLALALLATLAQHGRAGTRADAALESFLLRLLSRTDSALVLAAVQTLGPLGTAAAVPALRELEQRGPEELARAARQAVAEIQARLRGAEVGQLSIAGSEVGALSLAEVREEGRVSLVSSEEPESVPASRRGQAVEES